MQDIHGHAIYTDEQLFTYLQQFEGDFSAVPGRVIDATEGGVRKAGTRIMTLAQAAEEHCRRPIPPERFAYRRQLKWRDPSRLAAGRKQVQFRRDEVSDLVATCEKMLGLLKELTGLVEQPPEFNRRIAEVDALRVRIRAQDKAYQMVSAVSQHAELQRFSADRRLGLQDLDSAARARGQLERDIRFVEAIIEGAGVLREIMDESLARFDAAMAKDAS